MPIAAVVESLESIPEGLREIYIEQDGKWILDTNVEEHPRTLGLRSGLDKERKDRRTAQATLEKFKDVDLERWGKLRDLDEEEFTEYQAWKEKRHGDPPPDDEAVKKKIQSVVKQHEKILQEKDAALSERDTRIDALTAELARTKIETRLIDACGKLGVLGSAHDDVLNAGTKVFRIDEEGQVVAMDKEGSPLLGADGKPLDPQAWLEARHADRPHWFAGSKGGGAGGGNNAPAGEFGHVRTKADFKSAAEKAAYIRNPKYGRDRYLSLPEK